MHFHISFSANNKIIETMVCTPIIIPNIIQTTLLDIICIVPVVKLALAKAPFSLILATLSEYPPSIINFIYANTAINPIMITNTHERDIAIVSIGFSFNCSL